jgi:hypothetical protein
MLCNKLFPFCGDDAVAVVENTTTVSPPYSLACTDRDEFILWDYKNCREEPIDAEFVCGTHRRMKKAKKPRDKSYVDRHLAKERKKAMHFVVQSEEVTDTENTTADVVRTENMTFKDDALSQRLVMGDMSAGDYDADADATAGLGDFFSRPVRIANINWPESSTLVTSMNPWSLFFNNPLIKQKLQNYGKISCRLHLKFVINASPFYYGSARACWFPLGGKRSDYVNSVDQIPFSQVPGVYLEPQTMSTAEMVLPFLWPRNWLEATSIANFDAMGVLQIIQYAALRSANGVSGTGITIGVYAWAEDVRLMGPTTIGALQSDEYDDPDGTVSGPLTAAANVASMLTEVPVIGEYAMAAEAGARTAASIAKLFGYSNPPVIDDVHGYVPKAFHALANVETRMPIDKLSIDPKNEVTISPEVAGIQEDDPLAFSNLLTKESFIMGTNWANSSATDTLLWSALVSPSYRVTQTTPNFSCMPPMTYFGRAFRFWRGSIVYKFRFIKTKYHKGRVLISWDPNGDISSNADTETVTFSRIVDLSVEDEVEVVIPYKATAPWLRTTTGTGFMSNGPTPTYTYNSVNQNGCITMRVQNVLTGPAANPTIDVLVYARAGDDFQFSVPSEISYGLTVHDPAGIIQSEETDDVISQQNTTVDAKVAAITVGETIASMRPVLHRASLAFTQYLGQPTVGSGNGVYYTTNIYPRIPVSTGRDANGLNYATGAFYFNYTPTHPLDYTLNCFVGYRGSVNWHVNPIAQGSNVRQLSSLQVYRTYEPYIINVNVTQRNTLQTVATLDTPNLLARNAVRYPNGTWTLSGTGQTGISLTNPATQSAVSVNIPQYSQFRFRQAFFYDRDLDPIDDAQTNDNVAISAKFSATGGTSTAGTDWPFIEAYVSAGVDFSPVFFLCTPRMFSQTSLPAAREVFP